MSYQYKAVSISSVIKNILSARGYQGSIAGVYKKAVNIKFGNYLITAADLNQRNLPYGILCDFSDIDLQNVLYDGDAAEINSERLFVRNRFFEISINSASIWSPEFYIPIQRKDVPSIKRNIEFIKKQIIQVNILDGLIPLFGFLPNLINSVSSEKISDSLLNQKAYESLRKFIKAINYFDGGLLVDEFKQLTGLGIGLTPSGDDILMGLLATLIITSKAPYRNWVMNIFDKILPQIKGLTNDVSINYHKAISQGYYPERFSNLISAIITAKSFTNVQPSMQEMLKWGQTSGYEIILGIIIGFFLSIENLKESNKPFSSDNNNSLKQLIQ